MNITLILFLIGILGFVLNRKNIILMLISIEIMLLSITFLILVSSLNIDDIIGQTYAIYIIAIAGAESAIGLGILVAFYRLNNSPDKNPRSSCSYLHFNLLPAVLLAPQPSTSLDGRRANFLKANPRNASRRSSGDKQASSYPSPLSHNEREGLGSGLALRPYKYA